jgi:hypothetical protein
MKEQILSLDHSTAVTLASVFARAQLETGAFEAEPCADLATALRRDFLSGVVVDSRVPEDGDLARTALLLLSEHPDHAATAHALVSNPRPERFAAVETIAAVVIGLVVLQTYVKIERDKSGKWTFKMKKEPASDGLLKALVAKLTRYMSD